MAKQSVISTQILENQALSGEIDLGTHRLIAIELPAGWNGTTITFRSKSTRGEDDSAATEVNNEYWKDVYDDAGAEVSLTVAANRITVIGTVTKAALGALRYLQIRSGTSATPFNQNPTRDIRLIVKEA